MKRQTIQMRVSSEIFALITQAAKHLGQKTSDFARTAAVKEANKVLGKAPTLPVIVATYDTKNKH